ncbi:MAG TPA: HAMP domain-containing sensor histidine kinase [Candidatus Saccharimonadales bacterium]|nr:HAMP domain-containing sensor histidine kinase [Candidatus Saccharimonadales bacterium]
MQPISPLTATAHELKSPLTLVSGLSATLLAEGEPLSLRQREYLERILLSSDRMLRVVQGLVDAYRVEQASFQLALEPVNVRQVAEEVAHELYPYSQKLGQTVSVRVRRQTTLVVANRLLLNEALFNLVDNALKHSRGSEVIIGGRLQKEHTRLSVANDGAQLSEADFQQLERRLGGEAQPLRAQGNSSGIGLYIVRQLITAMGGKLGLERATSGTSIYLDLFTSTQLQLF